MAALSSSSSSAKPFAGRIRWLVINFRVPVTIGYDAIKRVRYTPIEIV
jgi:hypothetical protein